MEHIFVLRSRNWQGCFTFIQSPLLSLYNHFSRNAFCVMSRCLEILFTSVFVYVGDIVLQQLAQERQSTSFQIFLSASVTNLSNPRKGFFSSLDKKLFTRRLLRRTICLKERKLIACMNVCKNSKYASKQCSNKENFHNSRI